MSFNDSAPQHYLDLQLRLRKLQSEHHGLVHECDCSYCDLDEIEDQERYDELQKEIEEIEETIARLKRYAKLCDIDLSARVKEPA